MTECPNIIVERRGASAIITLNRPDVLNAFDAAMRCGLRDSLLEAARDPAIRAVVITGAGRLFSSGADLKAGAPDAAATRAQLLNEYGPGVMAAATMPKPVIAALNGPAVGIGLAFALACDLRVMAETAYLQAPFNDVGLLPDGGLSWFLPRVLGYARAFEMVADSRRLTSAECLRLGLVNRVVADATVLADTVAWAQTLAARPALALAATKQALRQGLDCDLAAAIAREADLQSGLVVTADCAEGIAAFREKRRPSFSGR